LRFAVAIGAAAITYERYDTKTLKRTIRRDAVLCGVNTGLPGFSRFPDDKGSWTGFDVDFLCRAVAAAILRRSEKKVRFRFRSTPTNASRELQSRKVDILSRNSTWSMFARDQLRPVFSGGRLL